MKDVLKNPESQEFSRRAYLFDRHLKGMDWQKVRQAMVRHIDRWEGLVSVVLGVKPAYEFTKYELSVVDPLDFIPNELLVDFTIAKNGWLIDKKQVSGVILRNQDKFEDVDFTILSDDKYLESYIAKRSVSSNQHKGEIIKTGLLLGYPYNSVIEFVSGNKLEFFNLKAFPCKVTKTDKKTFGDYLSRVYSSSQMDLVLARNEENIKSRFDKSVENDNDSIKIIKEGAKSFLEIITSDKENRIFEKQFVYLAKDAFNQDVVTILLNTFSERFDVLSLKRSAKSIGINHDKYLDEILSVLNEGDIVPYMRLLEEPLDYKIGTARIPRQDLKDWLISADQQKAADLL